MRPSHHCLSRQLVSLGSERSPFIHIGQKAHFISQLELVTVAWPQLRPWPFPQPEREGCEMSTTTQQKLCPWWSWKPWKGTENESESREECPQDFFMFCVFVKTHRCPLSVLLCFPWTPLSLCLHRIPRRSRPLCEVSPTDTHRHSVLGAAGQAQWPQPDTFSRGYEGIILS